MNIFSRLLPRALKFLLRPCFFLLIFHLFAPFLSKLFSPDPVSFPFHFPVLSHFTFNYFPLQEPHLFFSYHILFCLFFFTYIFKYLSILLYYFSFSVINFMRLFFFLFVLSLNDFGLLFVFHFRPLFPPRTLFPLFLLVTSRLSPPSSRRFLFEVSCPPGSAITSSYPVV